MKTGKKYSIPNGSSANLEDGIIGYFNNYATGFNVNYAECTGQIGLFTYHKANELSGGDAKHVAKLYDGKDIFVDVIGKNANHVAYSYKDSIAYVVPAGSTITTKSGISITRGASGFAWTCNKKVLMLDLNSLTVSNISAGNAITASGENILFSVLK